MSHCWNGARHNYEKSSLYSGLAPGQIKGGGIFGGSTIGKTLWLQDLQTSSCYISFQILNNKSTKYNPKKYLEAFSICSLWVGCMCGCGGDNGGGVRVPRPLFLVPPKPQPHSNFSFPYSSQPNQTKLVCTAPSNHSRLSRVLTSLIDIWDDRRWLLSSSS